MRTQISSKYLISIHLNYKDNWLLNTDVVNWRMRFWMEKMPQKSIRNVL